MLQDTARWSLRAAAQTTTITKNGDVLPTGVAETSTFNGQSPIG
jgi:hypothetical protein